METTSPRFGEGRQRPAKIAAEYKIVFLRREPVLPRPEGYFLALLTIAGTMALPTSCSRQWPQMPLCP